MSGQLVDGRRISADVERIAQWWTAATQEARYALYQRAIRGEAEAPRLHTLQIAILLAEAEAGEIAEG